VNISAALAPVLRNYDWISTERRHAPSWNDLALAQSWLGCNLTNHLIEMHHL
jgi:hypothetical protein